MNLLILILSLFLFTAKPTQKVPEVINFGKFGDVTIYRNDNKEPDNVVLFISGDGGWEKGVVEMARKLVDQGAIVVGININTYRKNIIDSGERCVYAASDFENLSQYIQKKLNLVTYHMPILAGYSSGATLVYGLLAQAPSNTFKGGISLGFCSDLNIGRKMCKGSGLESKKAPRKLGFFLMPVKTLEAPWVVLDGDVDRICNTSDAERFVTKISNARFTALPRVGHGFSVDKNWLPQLIGAYKYVNEHSPEQESVSPSALKDLPLHVVDKQNQSSNDLMAVMLSGDGGWASLDQNVARLLNDSGIPVVGLNSLKYFWSKKTPNGAALDLERIIRFYSVLWKKKKILIIGYSMGADVLPFMVNRLPDDIKSRIVLLSLLSPSKRIGFQFHLTDWIGGHSRNDYYVLPEIEKIKSIPVLCLYGDDEKDSICLQLPSGHFKVVPLPGGHHYDGNYERIEKEIMDSIVE